VDFQCIGSGVRSEKIHWEPDEIRVVAGLSVKLFRRRQAVQRRTSLSDARAIPQKNPTGQPSQSVILKILAGKEEIEQYQ